MALPPERVEELKRSGYVRRYGGFWPPVEIGGQKYERPQWMVERDMFLIEKLRESPEALTREEHFEKLCDCFFSDPNGIFYFHWNPWAKKILRAFLSNNMVAVGGCADASKTMTLAVIGVMMFFVNPFNTKVLVTSTTLETAKGKIWGKICLAWDQIERTLGGPQFMPGRKMEGKGLIRYEYDGVKSQNAGLELIATTQSAEAKSVEKLQGYKSIGADDSSMVILIGDEWETLSKGLLNTAEWNILNKPRNKVIGAFNPSGRFTIGGMIFEPEGGWNTVTVEDEEWKTKKGGIAIHFDALKSPNVIAGKELYRGLPTIESIEAKKQKVGSEQSAGYWQMVRGWFSPNGETDSIYSETDILKYHADRRAEFLDEPVMFAGLDPAWTHGGDKAILVIGGLGNMKCPDGLIRKVFEHRKTIELDLEMTPNQAKDEQIVSLTAKYLNQFNVPPSNLGVDISGAASFGSLLAIQIGRRFMGLDFGSSPTDMKICPGTDDRVCSDVFDNLMSELWYVAKPMIRTFQIRGIDPDTISEMCQRTYKDSGSAIKIEKKKDMKSRIGKSPDRSDGLFIALHMARVRLGFNSTERAMVQEKPRFIVNGHDFSNLLPRTGGRTDYKQMAGRYARLSRMNRVTSDQR